MSTFIWGKIRFNKKVTINNYQRKNILVLFSDKKNDLFQIDKKENEMYFNIACGYDKMINPLLYKMQFLNCNESYFSINALKKEDDLNDCFEKLFLRIMELQNTIQEIFSSNNVEKIVYFHTDTGNENSIDEYELVHWGIDEFAEKFFTEIKNNKGFTPTIKVVFDKACKN